LIALLASASSIFGNGIAAVIAGLIGPADPVARLIG